MTEKILRMCLRLLNFERTALLGAYYPNSRLRNSKLKYVFDNYGKTELLEYA